MFIDAESERLQRQLEISERERRQLQVESARLREELRIATEHLEWQAKQRPERYPGEAATFAHDALIRMSVVE
jgi:hypothetical protein